MSVMKHHTMVCLICNMLQYSGSNGELRRLAFGIMNCPSTEKDSDGPDVGKNADAGDDLRNQTSRIEWTNQCDAALGFACS